MGYALGADIGGTKIATAIIDKKGNRTSRTELPSPSTDREAMFQQVIRCMEETLGKSGLSVDSLEGIGVGVCGKVDPKNGVAIYQNNLPWSDFPLARRIKEHFSIKNVVIDNDVYMAAFGEWVMHGKNLDETFVYLTISTGVSCCTINQGEFVRGAGFAGEVGFLPVKAHANGFERLEFFASGPAIARAANGSQGYENAGKWATPQVMEAYKQSDPTASEVMKEIISAYAKGIYTISCLLDPDQLVLGGGVINHHPDLLKPIQAALGTYLVPDQEGLIKRMDVSRIQEGSGLVGAGLNVLESS